MQKMNRKAISGVISTTLLILVGIMAVTVIYFNVTSLIRESETQFSPEFSCLDLQSHSVINIESSCYNSESKELELKLKRSISDLEIQNLDFTLEYKVSSDSFCCGSPDCTNCKVLNHGELKVYYFPISEEKSRNLELSMVSISSCILDTKEVNFNC